MYSLPLSINYLINPIYIIIINVAKRITVVSIYDI